MCVMHITRNTNSLLSLSIPCYLFLLSPKSAVDMSTFARENDSENLTFENSIQQLVLLLTNYK